MVFYRFKYLLFLFFVLVCVANAQLTKDSNFDESSQRSWQIGPYSSVATRWGAVRTTLPIFAIKGPGDSIMELSLNHVSNQLPGSAYGAVDGQAGIGWWPSTFSFCNNNTQWRAGNQINSFAYAGGINPPTYRPKAGTRASLEAIATGGFVVTEQGTLKKFNYLRPKIGVVGSGIPPYKCG